MIGPRIGGAALAAALAAAGCGGGGQAEESGGTVVFAAASLTDAFTRIGDEVEAANPGLTITFSFAGSSALARQINEGAPADVFASAAPANMQDVVEAGNAAGTPVTFARNQLVIAVPAGNPDRIEALADLAEPGLKVALCAEQVPCGAAARTALDAAEVDLTPATLEQDVRATLAKLTLGEVDAALVYRTDVTAAASDVEGIEFPESTSAINDYPIVVLADAPAAEAFVDHVLSEPGQAVLAEAGFLPAG